MLRRRNPPAVLRIPRRSRRRTHQIRWACSIRRCKTLSFLRRCVRLRLVRKLYPSTQHSTSDSISCTRIVPSHTRSRISLKPPLRFRLRLSNTLIAHFLMRLPRPGSSPRRPTRFMQQSPRRRPLSRRPPKSSYVCAHQPPPLDPIRRPSRRSRPQGCSTRLLQDQARLWKTTRILCNGRRPLPICSPSPRLPGC